MIEKTCLFCGKYMSLDLDPSSFIETRDFCSESCEQKYRAGETHLSEDTKEVIYNITKKIANE